MSTEQICLKISAFSLSPPFNCTGIQHFGNIIGDGQLKTCLAKGGYRNFCQLSIWVASIPFSCGLKVDIKRIYASFYSENLPHLGVLLYSPLQLCEITEARIHVQGIQFSLFINKFQQLILTTAVLLILGLGFGYLWTCIVVQGLTKGRRCRGRGKEKCACGMPLSLSSQPNWTLNGTLNKTIGA
jgi:hypothetical protein